MVTSISFINCKQNSLVTIHSSPVLRALSLSLQASNKDSLADFL